MKPCWLAKYTAIARAAVTMTAVCALLYGASARAAFVDTPDDAKPEDQTLLLADEISYDQDANIVTAAGGVEIQRSNRLLMADKVVYDRNADIATATGHVSILDNTGTVFYFDNIQVTGDLKQ